MKLNQHTMLAIVICGLLATAFLYAMQVDIEDLQAVVKTQAKQIKQLEQHKTLKPVSVTVTAYSPRESETDSTPFKTAFMDPVKLGTVAVSRDLFLDGWTPGRKVYIYQIGVFEISDLMHHRKSNHLDIFFWTHDQAIQFGIKKSRAILLDI